MSEQRPALALWTLAMLWAAFCFFYRQRKIPLLTGLQQYGGLNYSAHEGRFFDAQGEHVRLTPMQQQLMEMFFRSDTHLLTKTEICSTLWPKKEDAHRATFRPEDRVRQRSLLRTEIQIVSHLSANCQTNVRQIICHFSNLFIPLQKKASMKRFLFLSMLVFLVFMIWMSVHEKENNTPVVQKLERAMRLTRMKEYHDDDYDYAVRYPSFFEQTADSLLDKGCSRFSFWQDSTERSHA